MIYEQQRTWLRLHTDKSQLLRGLGEDWQELMSSECEKQGTGQYYRSFALRDICHVF